MLKRAFLGFTVAMALVACAAPLANSAPAQTPQEVVSNYTTGLQNRNGRAVREVFHPYANLHSINGNKPSRTSSGTFASGVGLGGLLGGGRPRSPAMKSVVKLVDADAQAGVIRVDLDFGNGGIVDYLMVARLGEEWKIISKVFEGPTEPLNTDLDAARLPINRFLASRTSWDGEQFSAATYETAQVFSVSNGQLTTATSAQALAEYTQAKATNRAPEVSGQIDAVETFGTSGYARFHTLAENGTTINRAAFLLKNRAGWRIISMHSWSISPSAPVEQPAR